MTPQGLIAICKQPVTGLDGAPFLPDHIYLTLPKKNLSRDSVRLAGRSGPLGCVCTVNETDAGLNVVAVFNRKAVIAFLERALKGQ